jgi:hypothetical protein
VKKNTSIKIWNGNRLKWTSERLEFQGNFKICRGIFIKISRGCFSVTFCIYYSIIMCI